MRSVEQFICGKENNPDTCEDGLFIGTELVAVIDGATTKSRYLWNGLKSAAMERI